MIFFLKFLYFQLEVRRDVLIKLMKPPAYQVEQQIPTPPPQALGTFPNNWEDSQLWEGKDQLISLRMAGA